MKNNDIKFEKLRKPIRKKIIIGSLVAVAVVSAITITTSRAKYRLTQSIPVVRGRIYYYNGDLNVMAMYKQKDNSTCTEDNCYDELSDITRMPTGNYAINETKSYCKVIDTIDNEAKLYSKWVDGKFIHVVENLRKKDKCYLYFDKKNPPISASTIIANIKSKSNGTKSSFSSVATTNEGIFEASDETYGGTSYYWRGAVTDNHVIFAGFCWRIIRINGDDTIRMIYNGDVQSGNTCLGNVANAENVQIGTSAYNTAYNYSYYVGWTQNGSQRTTGGTPSTINVVVNNWYKTNIIDKGYDSKVASGKYCNDREVGIGGNTTNWSVSGAYFMYESFNRVYETYQPTLSCNSGDIYNAKVGLITVDEVMYAGGKNRTANLNYWLRIASPYWTMSPCNWNGSANIFYISGDGSIDVYIVNYKNSMGIRPVINLSTSATFKTGATGEATSPYVVNNT